MTATPDTASVPHECFADVGGGITLCYETFGAADAPPLLLVMGLGSQMIFWDDEFCAILADAGHRVIRFDNRDCGRSTVLDDAPVPTRRAMLTRDPATAAYPLAALAQDAIGLLDHLGIERAPIAGVSMGGMIVQLMAINHPERVTGMVSIMSTTGRRWVGNPKPPMMLRLLRPAGRLDRIGYAEEAIETLTAIGSRTNPPDQQRLRAQVERAWDRGIHPDGTSRQFGAILTTADRTRRLKQLRIPAAVIHGTEDPLVAPSGGKATARAIPGAQLHLLPGMGHDLPRVLWPQITDVILGVARAAGAGSGPPA